MKKRALYIGFNRKYVNKYLELVQNVIGNCFDLEFFGPGFSSSEDIKLGLKDWLKTQKTFEIVFLDPLVPLYQNQWSKKKFKETFRMNHLEFSYRDFSSCIRDYNQHFKNIKNKKVIICVYDFYALEDYVIDYVIESGAYVIDSFGKNLNTSFSQIKNNFGKSKFFLNKKSFSNKWYEFEENFGQRIISFPHAVYSSELSYTPIDRRNHKFNVVGVLYPERKEAIKLLAFKKKFKLFLGQLISFMKLKLNLTQMNVEKIEYYNFQYNNIISQSKFVYCSGSPLQYAVRKYFEIPAKSAVAIGWTCIGFEHLGFEHDVNFIVAKNNIQIENVFNTYSTKKLQRIADQGYKLIRDHHSIHARTHQMQQVFGLILEGKFYGSYWENGKYVYETC